MHDIISKLPLFAGLPLKEQISVAKWFVTRRYKRGEALFHEGEKVSHLAFVYQGKLKLMKHTPQGKDVILDIAMPYEAINLETVWGDGMQFASAFALEDTSIALVERQVVRRLAESFPVMQKAALDILAVRSMHQLDLITELSVAKVDSRIAATLLRLGTKLGQNEQSGAIRIDVHLSRQDIADLSGTTIESAIRALSRFGKENLIATTKDRILISDRESLADIAGLF